MSIIEKILKSEELTQQETELERACILLQISKMREILIKLTLEDQEKFSKALSILMIYYPKDWSKSLLKGMDEQILKKLIEEEKYLI